MARILYARVSTEEQNLARQLVEASEYDKVFVEKVSGKNMNRPQLMAMLNYVRKGDVLEVDSYSRLARNTRDLLEIVDKLKEKGVRFVSKKENIDTTTPTGEFMLTVFAGLYEFERATIRQRQAEGIEIAKANGVYKGRKPIEVDPDKFASIYQLWKSGNITARMAMEMLSLKPNTFYRRVKVFEAKPTKEELEREKEFESILRLIDKSTDPHFLRKAIDDRPDLRTRKKEYRQRKAAFIEKYGEQWKERFEQYE